MRSVTSRRSAVFITILLRRRRRRGDEIPLPGRPLYATELPLELLDAPLVAELEAPHVLCSVSQSPPGGPVGSTFPRRLTLGFGELILQSMSMLSPSGAGNLAMLTPVSHSRLYIMI